MLKPNCKVLLSAPSTYYAHASGRRDPGRLSVRARRHGVLRTKVRRVFRADFRVYGVRKEWRQMKREGFDIGC